MMEQEVRTQKSAQMNVSEKGVKFYLRGGKQDNSLAFKLGDDRVVMPPDTREETASKNAWILRQNGERLNIFWQDQFVGTFTEQDVKKRGVKLDLGGYMLNLTDFDKGVDGTASVRVAREKKLVVKNSQAQQKPVEVSRYSFSSAVAYNPSLSEFLSQKGLEAGVPSLPTNQKAVVRDEKPAARPVETVRKDTLPFGRPVVPLTRKLVNSLREKSYNLKRTVESSLSNLNKPRPKRQESWVEAERKDRRKEIARRLFPWLIPLALTFGLRGERAPVSPVPPRIGEPVPIVEPATSVPIQYPEAKPVPSEIRPPRPEKNLDDEPSLKEEKQARRIITGQIRVFEAGDSLNKVSLRNLAPYFGNREENVPDDLRRIVMLSTSFLNGVINPDDIKEGAEYKFFAKGVLQKLAESYLENSENEVWKTGRILTEENLVQAQQQAWETVLKSSI